MIVFATLLLCFLTSLLIYSRILSKRHSYFEQRGILTPPYRFFFGHFKTIWSIKLLTHHYRTWTQEYGPIYGLFEGTRPLYVVSDVDFLQEIYIKQFSSFHSRRLPFIFKKSFGNTVHVLAADGAEWHRQRHIMNPAFTSAKLKSMSSSIHQCVDSLIKKVEEHAGNEINIYLLYKRLTMDVICRCAFGVVTDLQNDLDNEYFQQAELSLGINIDEHPLIRLGYLMPWLIPVLTFILAGQIRLKRFIQKFVPSVKEIPRFWLMNRLRYLINLRVKYNQNTGNQRISDLLQIMLDTATNQQLSREPVNRDKRLKLLSHDELSANIYLFLIAGYETSSTALAYSAYVLAKEPRIQVKLQEAIDNDLKDDSDYEQILNITYLNWFIDEVLRMYPIAPLAMTRECNQTTNVRGHLVEKGCVIQPDILSVHYNPELWGPEDPNIFCPERHSVSRHPVAFMPFGVGPRNCLGKRFALMEVKICLTRILREYSIRLSDRTESNFELKDTLVILQPKAVYVKIEKRSHAQERT